jgi:hypothetical protein
MEHVVSKVFGKKWLSIANNNGWIIQTESNLDGTNRAVRLFNAITNNEIIVFDTNKECKAWLLANDKNSYRNQLATIFGDK